MYTFLAPYMQLYNFFPRKPYIPQRKTQQWRLLQRLYNENVLQPNNEEKGKKKWKLTVCLLCIFIFFLFSISCVCLVQRMRVKRLKSNVFMFSLQKKVERFYKIIKIYYIIFIGWKCIILVLIVFKFFHKNEMWTK